MNKESKEKAKLVYQALEEKKGGSITIINIADISVLADYFIIADGTNRNQVQALADEVDKVLSQAGYEAKKTEGYSAANWILHDYGDVVVHIFNREDRLFYDLERIWRDGKTVTIEELEN